jgi:5-methylcytosine-specific restriction enzyme subunit McrC
MYSQLHSRIGNLMLYFPEMPDIKISPAIFDRIVLDRKTKHYEGAIKIARLILLRLSPDISRGSDEVLALMFDMNKLWEKFIYVSLRKNREEGLIVNEQSPKKFWRAQGGSASTMRPDIVVKMDNRCVVLDTKWKSLKGSNPSPEDLRQMFVYHQYFEAERVALVYPGNTGSVNKGKYLDPFTAEDTNKECSIVVIDVNANILEWQKDIYIKLSNMWSYAHTV